MAVRRNSSTKSSTWRRLSSSILFLSTLIVLSLPRGGWGAISCASDQDCKAALLEGSECINQVCTNPFHHKGCLGKYMPELFGDRTRVCHSDDPPEALKQGHCRLSPSLDYMEVRILSQDWESAFFEAWIMQILLSEVLDVPATIETGHPERNVDFYNVDSSFDYGIRDIFHSELEVSANIQDCRKLDQGYYKNSKPTEVEYEPCAHVVTEVWQFEQLQDTKPDGTGPFRELGAIGGQNWFVPKYTAERDATVTTYIGLKGEQNRRKMAERFKRPLNWSDYCTIVSENKCAGDSIGFNEHTNSTWIVTSRAPADENEGKQYYVEGLYTGYFHATEKNNCDLNPTNCTGHIADYPCSWNMYTPQQLYHNEIALESNGPDDPNGGYTYSQLVQIWTAANTTRSDVMMMWWFPESMYERYVGTDAEYTRVMLPAPTQECIDARLPFGIRCDPDFDVTTTDPKGACDAYVVALKKLVGDGLYDNSRDKLIPEALRSPAYDTMLNFVITSPQLGQIFKYWFELNRDSNFDARDATCRFVVENLDQLRSFIPETYPRFIEEEDVSTNGLFTSIAIVAGFAILTVFFATVKTYQHKDTKSMFYSQSEYIFLLLFGLFLVSIGSLLMTFPPTDGSCVGIIWLVQLGYAIHYTPLVVRVYAINKLATTGKQMQRVRLGQKQLFGSVLIALLVIGAFLLTWTVIDTPTKTFFYELTNQVVEVTDETIVLAYDFCDSEYHGSVWNVVSFAWEAALLLPGAIIGFVANTVRADMNDTRGLAIFLYIHLFFLGCRVIANLLMVDSKQSDLMAYESLFISADVVVGTITYIIPKVIGKKDAEEMDAEILPDLFLNTTIMVADVVGFTVWSSAREPIQVFKLLEELFENFDRLADKHKVYKVETVRDSYVAATGIPEAQANHALLIAKFAADCMKRMDHLSKKLEIMFGPDTQDLKLRIGIHSGPVTGGFLKGKNVFQLFGDTMTTTCLLQGTSESNRIHLSQATADLLIKAGKERWIEKRLDTVETAEKGAMETYWLTYGDKHGDHGFEVSSFIGTQSDRDDLEYIDGLDTQQRWVEWNVDVLGNLLKQIVARRATPAYQGIVDFYDADRPMPLEEVKEIIELPEFDKWAAKRQRHHDEVALEATVLSQLKQYVSTIASMYNPNPFHNFAHASYVVMAVTKYMNRIVAASEVDVGYDENRTRSSTQEAVHDHTYGITSDPLTQFACVFSALIHDVDHPGVPNPQYMKENDRLSKVYKGRSIAEQNSFDMSFDLLMDDGFDVLRSAICANEAELLRFRQLVVNSVMATDLGDKELKSLRNRRWEKAFKDDGSNQDENPRDAVNRKATIVIEHLIQAADIAHTCQHWGIYRKWNERLFQECYKAYREGRAEKNPAEYWYDGEIGFYDFYIIPLAEKLRDCGVFGPTSDENLDYAHNNKKMWLKDGKEIVAEMLQKVEAEYTRMSVSKLDTGEEKVEKHPSATFEA